MASSGALYEAGVTQLLIFCAELPSGGLPGICRSDAGGFGGHGCRQAAIFKNLANAASPEFWLSAAEEKPGAAMPDKRLQASHRSRRDRYAARRRLQGHQTEGFAPTRHQHNIGGTVVGGKQMMRLRSVKKHPIAVAGFLASLAD